MRVLILTNRQGNQIALANRISGVANVAGIVFSKNISRRKPDLKKRSKFFLNRIAGRTVGREFVDTWFRLQERYQDRFSAPPSCEIAEVDNVNDVETIRMIERVMPDLVVVSGTNIVGKGVIEAAHRGSRIVNLHTGISPYVKGAPNCTNWCLARNWFHLIGNTVMWLDAGVDTGNIIATEATPLTGRESLLELHWAVMEHAHEMYVNVIRRIAAGESVPSVPQSDIGSGNYFEAAEWNAKEMRSAIRNFRTNYADYFGDRDEYEKALAGLRLYPLGNA